MLRQRVITAVVLLAVLLPALFASSAYWFISVTLLLIAPGAWEWARLNGCGPAVCWLSGLAMAGACLTLLLLGLKVGEGTAWWCGVTGLWAVGGAWALRAGSSGWAAWPRPLRWALGMVLLWSAWSALAHARVVGVNFVLSVLCIVWMADIAAYFGGRRFGRRKLAPRISPGKSWEGVYSGLAGVALMALLWRQADLRLAADAPSLFTQLAQRWGVLPMLVAACALAGLSVVGDLFESLVKRAAGAKDSSGLLPGHGGVLDRVDALLPTLPAAMALVTW